jgi:hypothetical protein
MNYFCVLCDQQQQCLFFFWTMSGVLEGPVNPANGAEPTRQQQHLSGCLSAWTDFEMTGVTFENWNVKEGGRPRLSEQRKPLSLSLSSAVGLTVLYAPRPGLAVFPCVTPHSSMLFDVFGLRRIVSPYFVKPTCFLLSLNESEPQLN